MPTRYPVFCLPPAGSSAHIYRSWQQSPTSQLDIIPLEYPGHGTKMRQSLIRQTDLLAKIMTEDILATTDQPFILFGHSLGGSLIWKIKDELQAQHKTERLKLMVISSRPEHQHSQHVILPSPISDHDILERLQRYRQFPDEIMQQADARRFFLNIIRHDFKLSNQLFHEPLQATDIPVTAFYGNQDPDIPDPRIMSAWQNHTSQWRGCTVFTGDHFYFLQHYHLASMQAAILAALHHPAGSQPETLAPEQKD